MEDLENQVIGLRRDLGSVISQFNADKKAFTDEINGEFQRQKILLGEVVEGARKEFIELRTGMNELHGRVEITVTNMQQRITKLEEKSNFGGSGGIKGYLP